ncbi:MAG: condensation domain-containing protein [Oscillospiraceae bacterium]|nr:condensation domain-containing protein [Oscillospiraceae bacterium]
MPKNKIQAELWDKMHYLFRDFNDRMVHVLLSYDEEINIDALKTVIICFFEKVPILHSSFVSSPINPYWEEKDYKIEDVFSFYELQDDENLNEKAEEFLMQYIPPESHVQMKIAVFNKNGKSTICFVENHMCMDGGDLKHFLASFFQSYTEYVEKQKSPLNVRTGSRSFEEVYESMSQTEKIAAKRLYKNVSNRDKHKFPFTKDSKEDKSFIARKIIPAEKFEMVRLKGKKIGATVNDVLAAAFLHSMYEISNYDEDEKISVSCAIDLRRHINDLSDVGYTNHTAFMALETPRKGRNITETVEYVKICSQKNKADKFMGLYGLPLLKLAYTIMPYAASEEAIKIGYSNPMLGMSNMGALDVEKLSFCGNRPVDGFITGAVKYKPYSLMSATTLNGELTLAICERGNEKDKELVNSFFDLIEKHLDEFITE